MQSLSDLPWCLSTADPASYVCPGLRASASHVPLKGSSLQGRDRVTGYGGLSQVSRTSPNGTEKDKAGQEQVQAEPVFLLPAQRHGDTAKSEGCLYIQPIT